MIVAWWTSYSASKPFKFQVFHTETCTRVFWSPKDDRQSLPLIHIEYRCRFDVIHQARWFGSDVFYLSGNGFRIGRYWFDECIFFLMKTDDWWIVIFDANIRFIAEHFRINEVNKWNKPFYRWKKIETKVTE